VADGQTAIERAREGRPDLILLDVGLPGLSGRDVLERLRADASTATIPIVYLTGLAPQEGPRPDGLLAKPFTPTVLRSTLLALC
jgi:CheY-like chemotaxis protein